MNATWKGSRHFSRGRRGYRPEAVVVHIMDGTLADTDAWFNDPRSKISAHYGVGRNGEIHQYVCEADQAWHAGDTWTPSWAGHRHGVNPNLYTIGIEHEGKADDPWPAAMYEASAGLIKEICLRWNIASDRAHVIGHREFHAHRVCPGSQVDLAKLVGMAAGSAVDLHPVAAIEQKGSVVLDLDENELRQLESEAGAGDRALLADPSAAARAFGSALGMPADTRYEKVEISDRPEEGPGAYLATFRASNPGGRLLLRLISQPDREARPTYWVINDVERLPAVA